MNNRSKILSWLVENNYTLKVYGPKYTGNGNCDIETFEAVAERIVENGILQ